MQCCTHTPGRTTLALHNLCTATGHLASEGSRTCLETLHSQHSNPGWSYCWALVMQGKLSGQVMMATLSVVGTRAMQVYTSAQFARARVRLPACSFGQPY